tara:strand:- start:490 stop:1359 length:870 start_codon:yes stop_codon:yes gene_type:complete
MNFNVAKVDYNSILLHLHIPKSGGKSVDENLKKYFTSEQFLKIGESSINHYCGKNINSYIEYNRDDIIKKLIRKFNFINKLLQFQKNFKHIFTKNVSPFRDISSLTLSQKQTLRFISSYQERNVIPPILGKHYLQTIIIRDPLSRLQSYYFQAKKQFKSKKPYIIAAHKYDINGFINYLFDYQPYMLNNPYCVCITGTEDFLKAKKIIDKNFFLAAPIERLDDFLNIMTLKLFSKKGNFIKYNVGYNNSKKIIISENLIDKILLTNQPDIKLKKYIEQEFGSIYEKIKF